MPNRAISASASTAYAAILTSASRNCTTPVSTLERSSAPLRSFLRKPISFRPMNRNASDHKSDMPLDRSFGKNSTKISYSIFCSFQHQMNRSRKSCSDRISTPSSFAFLFLEEADMVSLLIRKLVFDVTLPVTFPPLDSIRFFSSLRLAKF